MVKRAEKKSKKKRVDLGPAKVQMKKTGTPVQRVTAPAATTVVIGKSEPVLRSNNRGTRVCNTEVLISLDSNTGTTINLIPCIPGRLAWLGPQAAGWSRWRWINVRYTYIPAAPTSIQGTVAMGFIYDYMDGVPSGVSEMSSLSGFTTGAVWSGSAGSAYLSSYTNERIKGAVSTTLDIRDRAKRWLYITRTQLDGLESATDKNIYVPARLVIAMTNSTENRANVGTIYVTYEVELIDTISPRLNLPTQVLTPVAREARLESETQRDNGQEAQPSNAPNTGEVNRDG
nr:capsid protein [Solemoviridae sp.]